MKIRCRLLTLFLLLPFSEAFSQDYGGLGYVDMPSAYMMEDADIKFSNSRDFYHESSSITYQISPFLMGTFRYSGFHSTWIWDRNIEVKARLLSESRLLPEVSLGIRDIGGTNIFGGEYLVGSKTIENLSISLGIGWGRLNGDGDFSNPLALLSDNFEGRGGSTGRGGTFRVNDYFSGEKVGIFGGLSYSLRNYPIEFLAEYSSDNFSGDANTNIDYQMSPFNFGLKWNREDNTSFMLTHQYGDWGITANYVTNTRNTPRTYLSEIDSVSNDLVFAEQINFYELLNYEAYRRGLNIIDGDIDYEAGMITMIIAPSKINYPDDLLNQAYEILRLHLPRTINKARVIVMSNGYLLYEWEIDIDPLSLDPLNHESSHFKDLNFYESPYWGTRGLSRLDLDWSLRYNNQLFDPDNPIRSWFTFGPNLTIRLLDEWVIRGRYDWTIYDEFGDNRRDANSVLPHVRTDLMKYLTEGKNGFDHLYLSKRGNLDQNWKYNFFFGYLEWMYAGIGIDLLHYDPFNEFAYGFNYSKLKQRAFDRGFGFNDLDAETFFISGYWDSPVYDLDIALHVGQYLAGDKGATLDIRRSFPSGWEVGAFATLTDVPFEDFGEGSFDKGLYFTFPWSNYFDQNLVRATRNKVRFIQRDGGQYLDGYVGQFWFDMQHFDPRNL